MPDAIHQDPYELHAESIEPPPTSFAGIYRKIGPGLILAGTVVGSGELIATTILGAENGYTLLWLILVSCVIKIVVQNELGRYTIGTGETSLAAFNRVPGPRLGVSWVVWTWFLAQIMVMFGIGGMLGAISEVLNTMLPGVPIRAWVWVINVVTVALLVVGRYELIEKASVVMVVAFTVITVVSAGYLLGQPQYFSWIQLTDGLTFQLPEGGFLTAIAVFGITGVGASELSIYPYWCIEKGYARFTGPRPETNGPSTDGDDSDKWRARARGWIRVMGFDVVNAMVFYTLTTVAFYLLGAGVLRGMGVMPQGSQMVDTLSNMYTETLGGWSRYIFLPGAVAVFYSTVFAGTAARGRMMADILALLGAYDKKNYALRLTYTRLFIVFFLLVPTAFFFFVEEPVLMVKIAGLTEAMLLPVVAFSTVYLRYRHLPKAILPKGWITLALWLTSAVMLVMTTFSILQQLGTF